MFQGKTPGEVFSEEVAQQEKDTDMLYKLVGGRRACAAPF